MKYTKKRLNEFAKTYNHLSKGTIEVHAADYKTERGFINYLERANAEAEAEHNKSLPIYIEMDVEWKKSAVWGYNPSVSMRWEDADGKWHYQPKAGYASGCGYDKHSAAVAEALNDYFKNLLFSIRNKDFKKAPYGIRKYNDFLPCFEGGVGMSCYPRIMEWLGYEMKHTAWTDTYDKWVIVKKTEKRRFA